ncbi:protein of unknown function [Methylococcus capsulatus]|uniref:Uncharacterized protein n=1 Tax=Methylococcus capsulatus TaxID=414 RepID=A0AA35UTE0_METCP|nr:protein of unknown function [Methylococcus capsulatus]
MPRHGVSAEGPGSKSGEANGDMVY